MGHNFAIFHGKCLQKKCSTNVNCPTWEHSHHITTTANVSHQGSNTLYPIWRKNILDLMYKIIMYHKNSTNSKSAVLCSALKNSAKGPSTWTSHSSTATSAAWMHSFSFERPDTESLVVWLAKRVVAFFRYHYGLKKNPISSVSI